MWIYISCLGLYGDELWSETVLFSRQVLLSYGDSPNYRDTKGLTPLYHTAIMGDDIGACHILLRNRAELEIQDQGGWSELHHVSAHYLITA